MSEMIVLTIGPVQSYISQARRTQDLWQGSRILSYLAGVGVVYAQAMEQQGLAKVIYPVIPDAQDDDRLRDKPANIPNRIVVCWLGDHEGARDCAAEMKAAIQEAWETVSDNTLRYFINHNELHAVSEKIEEIWQRQEKNWLECYWVVVPEDGPSHAENMLRANDAMGARKLMHSFSQIDEHGIKCSITGEHEILHDDRKGADFWKAIRAEQRNLALLGEHERLSAISTIKRMAHEEVQDEYGNWIPINPPLQIKKRFPSTSSIAVAPFKYDVLRAFDETDANELKNALAVFLTALEQFFDNENGLYFNRGTNLNEEYFGLIEHRISPQTLDDDLVRRFRSMDGDFLFEDTLISKTIEEYSGWKRKTDQEKAELKAQIRDAQEALKGLIEAAQKLDITKPQPYLVILSMDGDHMGRALGKLLDAEEHRCFSATLANFARDKVIQIVEQTHLGRVVYAGGDDILALLPVRGALEVAEELRTMFEDVMNDARILNCNERPITVHASTGLAYVHHTHNLQDAIRAANSVQKDIAKDSYGRNALGVQLLRRSGEPRTMGQKWLIEESTLYEHVNVLTQAFREHLSRNLPYDIAQIVYSMTGGGVTDAAREAELRRVLNRRLPGDLADKAQISLDLSDHILALVHGFVGDLETRWRNAQCWLELARFMAQKESGA